MLDAEERLKIIFDLSEEYFKDFLNQKNIVEEVENIHLNTNRFANIKAEEVKTVAKDLSDFVYAALLYENSFYIHNSVEHNQRQFLVFLSQEELFNYQQKNNSKVIYFKLDDLLWLVEYYKIDLVVAIMDKQPINFSAVNLYSFVNDGILNNINGKSMYVVRDTGEYYNEVVKEMSETFRKYPQIKEVHLYRVLELKEITENNLNEKNELTYNVMVVDMPYDGFFHVRDYLMKLIAKNNKDFVNVVPKGSALGKQLITDSIKPVFVNK